MIIAHDAIWDDIAHEAIGWQITFAMILLVGSVVIGALWPIGCAILTCMAIYRHPEWERQFASPARDTQTDPDTLR